MTRNQDQWKYSISYADEAPVTAPIPLCGPIAEAMKQAAGYGYNAIEIHAREDAPLDLQEIMKASKEYGISISALVTGRLFTQGKCSLLDDAVYASERAMEGLRNYVLLAEQLHTDIVIGWAKGNVPIGGERPYYLRRLSDALGKLGKFGAEHNVRILLEVINRYEVNIFTTAAETRAFIVENKLDNCWVHLDTFHMGIDELNPYEAIRDTGSLLGYFHVADNSRHYPGSGQFDFPKILKTLEGVGYHGYINVECFPWPDREMAARRSLEHLKASEPS